MYIGVFLICINFLTIYVAIGNLLWEETIANQVVFAFRRIISNFCTYICTHYGVVVCSLVLCGGTYTASVIAPV